MGMTEQEAIISHIEECKHRIYVIQNYIKYNRDANVKRCERNVFILENIIKALEKQIAKKPIGISVNEDSMHVANCPNCGRFIMQYRSPIGCIHCLQRLDWGE